MATEFVRQQPIVSGFSGGRITGWVKTASRKLLARKKQLIIGTAGLAVVALAAFYFWGGNASTVSDRQSRAWESAEHGDGNRNVAGSNHGPGGQPGFGNNLSPLR